MSQIISIAFHLYNFSVLSLLYALTQTNTPRGPLPWDDKCYCTSLRPDRNHVKIRPVVSRY